MFCLLDREYCSCLRDRLGGAITLDFSDGSKVNFARPIKSLSIVAILFNSQPVETFYILNLNCDFIDHEFEVSHKFMVLRSKMFTLM